jgi:hypothetical protein
MLNDWGLIQEFGGFDENLDERLAKLHTLDDEAAVHGVCGLRWNVRKEALRSGVRLLQRLSRSDPQDEGSPWYWGPAAPRRS